MPIKCWWMLLAFLLTVTQAGLVVQCTTCAISYPICNTWLSPLYISKAAPCSHSVHCIPSSSQSRFHGNSCQQTHFISLLRIKCSQWPITKEMFVQSWFRARILVSHQKDVPAMTGKEEEKNFLEITIWSLKEMARSPPSLPLAKCNK